MHNKMLAQPAMPLSAQASCCVDFVCRQNCRGATQLGKPMKATNVVTAFCRPRHKHPESQQKRPAI